MRAIMAMALGLTACVHLPLSDYDGRYYGVLNEGILNFWSRREPGCGRQSYIDADVSQGEFTLWVKEYTIRGTVSPDRDLYGEGERRDDPSEKVTFTGHIDAKQWGQLMHGVLHDGKCNPYIELTIPKGK